MRDHFTCSYMTGTSGDDDLLLLSELEDLSKERPANVLNIPNDIFLRALSNVLNAAVLLVDCVDVPKRNSLCWSHTRKAQAVETCTNRIYVVV